MAITTINTTNMNLATSIEGLAQLLGIDDKELATYQAVVANHYWLADPYTESMLEHKYHLPFKLVKDVRLDQIDILGSLHNGARLEMPLDPCRVQRMLNSYVNYRHGMRPLVIWYGAGSNGAGKNGIVVEGNHCFAVARLLGLKVFWAYVIKCSEEAAYRTARSWNAVQGMGQKLTDSYLHAVHDLHSVAVVNKETIAQFAQIYEVNHSALRTKYDNDVLRQRAMRPVAEGGFGLTGDVTKLTDSILQQARKLSVPQQKELLASVLGTDEGMDADAVKDIVEAAKDGGDTGFQQRLHQTLDQIKTCADNTGPIVETHVGLDQVRRAMNIIKAFSRYARRTPSKALRAILTHHQPTWEAARVDLDYLRTYINAVLK